MSTPDPATTDWVPLHSLGQQLGPQIPAPVQNGKWLSGSGGAVVWADAPAGGLSDADVYGIAASKLLTGGGVLTYANGRLKWSTRIIVITRGMGAGGAGSGYFDIDVPPPGTAITGVGGAAGDTVTADGIAIPAWHALYYIPPIGGSHASVPANFRLATYQGNMVVPPSWLLLAFNNIDQGLVWVTPGTPLKTTGQTWNTNTGLPSPVHHGDEPPANPARGQMWMRTMVSAGAKYSPIWTFVYDPDTEYKWHFAGGAELHSGIDPDRTGEPWYGGGWQWINGNGNHPQINIVRPGYYSVRVEAQVLNSPGVETHYLGVSVGGNPSSDITNRMTWLPDDGGARTSVNHSGTFFMGFGGATQLLLIGYITGASNAWIYRKGMFCTPIRIN